MLAPPSDGCRNQYALAGNHLSSTASVNLSPPSDLEVLTRK